MMDQNERDQDAVAALLSAMPPVEVSPDFLARVNARIDETEGWLGLANFRAWTLGLVPTAAAIVLVAILWPVTSAKPDSSTAARSEVASSQSFTPSSYNDWQRDVSTNALLEAALSDSR